jgi:two-component system, OmpR family, response regulator
MNSQTPCSSNDFAGNLNVVEVHISILRSKLGDSDKSLIRTIRGLGYALGR